MQRFLRIFFILIAVLMVVAIAGGLYYYYQNDEPLPEGIEGPKAEQLADNMLAALNYEAWDETGAIKWSFRDAHHFIWDRNAPKGGAVEVMWDNNRVQFFANDHLGGKAWMDGSLQKGDQLKEKLETAWGHFCNDSFWLIAPFKVRDPGTSRKWVDLGEGEEGLLVTYGSRGVTPGDSYLWLLAEYGTPKAWKMWVNIIPVGGIKATWENYMTAQSGIRLAAEHNMEAFTLQLTDIAAGADLQAIGVSANHFADLK